MREVLGEGAFGRVYRGFDPDLGREVAIKVPHRESLNPALRERFLREARAAATIHHPNVCPIYDVGSAEDLPYIVMRFVPGPTLSGPLAQRASAFPPRHAMAIARKLALGVAEAHAQGVIHRDLKPQNVLWDDAKREVLVTDFGLARIGSETRMTADGDVLGTPSYMSPEQARGDLNAVGPLSDVYSLGVILYRMITGEVPYRGSVYEVMVQVWEGKPRPPSEVLPGLDPRVDGLCLKAMAKEPAARYASAKEFASALADFLRAAEKEETGRSTERPLPPPATASAPTVPPSGSDSSRKSKRLLKSKPEPKPKPHLELLELGPEIEPKADHPSNSRGPLRGIAAWAFAASLLLAVASTILVLASDARDKIILGLWVATPYLPLIITSLMLRRSRLAAWVVAVVAILAAFAGISTILDDLYGPRRMMRGLPTFLLPIAQCVFIAIVLVPVMIGRRIANRRAIRDFDPKTEPRGGPVRMNGAEPGGKAGERQGRPRSLWKRIVIGLAIAGGGLFLTLFATGVLIWAIGPFGSPVPTRDEKNVNRRQPIPAPLPPPRKEPAEKVRPE